ncbi:MAG: AraC family transcriptional regulator [Pleurocapsa sp.]
MSRNPLYIFETKPNISSISVRLEEDLYLHYRHDLPGQLETPNGFDYHLITFFLTNNERQVIHLDNHGEFYGQMDRGEFYLYPAGISGFTDWQAIDRTLHLIVKPNLLRKIALTTECLNPDRIELLPVLKDRDSLIEYLAQLFFAEMQNDNFGNQLYLESLSNALGIHLLRNYCVFKPIFRRYTDGLSPNKLRQIIDYIQSNLDKKLSLKTMAEIVNMDKYYFATQFKRAMGIAPHQYVIEQRVEKAKRLLQSRKQPLFEVALNCGFASQSHFNKVFRQYIGTTPKSYQKQF